MNFMLRFVSAIIILLTTVAAVSADFYLSSSGPSSLLGFGNQGTFRVTGDGYHAGGMRTADGGIYLGANTQSGAASLGYYDGAITGITVRSSNVRANTFRTTDGYAGTIGLGNRIHTPSYYHQGTYYGGVYAPMSNVYGAGQSTSNSRYVSTSSHMRSRY